MIWVWCACACPKQLSLRTKVCLLDNGFSLVELVLAMAIAGILAAVVAPSLFAALPNYRLKSAAHDLQRHVQLARLEAIKRGTQVIIEFTPGAHVSSGRVGSYTLCVDDNLDAVVDATDNNSQCDAGEPVLLRPLTMPNNVSLTATTFGGNRMVFSPRGMLNAGGTVNFQNDTILGQMTLSIVGRARLQVWVPASATWEAWD
ncbi:MAG: hypothetical protein BWK76_14190 [Desulfobulbaceae bacterium A2]|nr:MAG: hypothetical protein BWK76_14190 [Desulfobulbaceae bacterium A2]